MMKSLMPWIVTVAVLGLLLAWGPTTSAAEPGYQAGDYVTNRGVTQGWIGRIVRSDGATYTVRITYAGKKSLLVNRKGYRVNDVLDLFEDEFKPLKAVCADAMLKGYK